MSDCQFEGHESEQANDRPRVLFGQVSSLHAPFNSEDVNEVCCHNNQDVQAFEVVQLDYLLLVKRKLQYRLIRVHIYEVNPPLLVSSNEFLFEFRLIYVYYIQM